MSCPCTGDSFARCSIAFSISEAVPNLDRVAFTLAVVEQTELHEAIAAQSSSLNRIFASGSSSTAEVSKAEPPKRRKKGKAIEEMSSFADEHGASAIVAVSTAAPVETEGHADTRSESSSGEFGLRAWDCTLLVPLLMPTRVHCMGAVHYIIHCKTIALQSIFCTPWSCRCLEQQGIRAPARCSGQQTAARRGKRGRV